MGFINQLKTFIASSFSKKNATDTFVSLTESNRDIYALLGVDYIFGSKSQDFLTRAYGLNPYVFMVIDRLAQRLAQADTLLTDTKGKEVNDLKFNEITEQPNLKEGYMTFIYRAASTYLATGQCFVVRVQEIGERDQFFVPINYNVTIDEDTKGDALGYWVSRFGTTEYYLKTDVLHIKKPDITYETNTGFSTLQANRKVWESNNEVWASEASLHKNKGVSGVLYAKANRPMTDKELKELQAKYDKDNTGAAKFGKVKVSPHELGYLQMGMNPTDLKSIETRIEHLRTICASFNVDSKLFGDAASSTYNNMSEAQIAFIVNAVIPLSEVILNPVIRFMSKTQFKKYSMYLDYEAIPELKTVREQRSEKIGKEVMLGILTVDEAREMLYPELGKMKKNGTEENR